MTTEFQRIASAHNPRLKQALKLRQRRARDEQSRILIDGQREIALALGAGVAVDQLFVNAHQLADPVLVDWLRGCLQQGIEVLVLPEPLMAKLGYGDRHDQCVATAPTPPRSLSELRVPPEPLIAVLEAVEKPGNVGAVVRSADAAGIDAVIVADGLTDLFNPNAIRASRGTVFTVPLCAAPSAEVARWLDSLHVQVCVARVDAETSYDVMNFCRGSAIVLGNEAAGVSSTWRAPRYLGVKLPMEGQADSLNVAVTAAILFYEARRQRGRTCTGEV